MVFWYVFILIFIPLFFYLGDDMDDWDDPIMTSAVSLILSVLVSFVIFLIAFLIFTPTERNYLETNETTYFTSSVLYQDGQTIVFSYTDETGLSHQVTAGRDYLSIYQSDENKIVYTVTSYGPEINKWFADWICDEEHWDIYVEDPLFIN